MFGWPFTAKVIPNKNTKILIYCNNNFIDDVTSGKRFRVRNEKGKLVYSNFVTRSKLKKVPLNIPTFLNLYEYGYKQVYELGQAIEANKVKLEFESEK